MGYLKPPVIGLCQKTPLPEILILIPKYIHREGKRPLAYAIVYYNTE
jgi:hypothetical protein